MNEQQIHEAINSRVDGLETGHARLSAQITENTELTRQAIVATQDLTNIINALSTLAKVAKWVSVIAIAVSSVWGIVILATGGGSGITPK